MYYEAVLKMIQSGKSNMVPGLIGHYKNGNYYVLMFNDGTKVRMTEDSEFKPEFAENCDVKITNKCGMGCTFCYEGCTAAGQHGHLMNEDGTPYYSFMNTLHPYTEMALNGNDLDHPELESFLQFLRSKKIFPNITVNQGQFIKNFDIIADLVEQKLVFGVGVSITRTPDDKLLDMLTKIPNAVLHTIAGILNEEMVNVLRQYSKKIGWWEPKILILGYKTNGRGIDYLGNHNDEIKKNIEYVVNNLEDIQKFTRVVSFDNLAIKQLEVYKNVFDGKRDDWDKFYMGDDGAFTFYIDLVKGQYAKNSTMRSDERYNINPHMTIDSMFKKFQK